MGVVLTRRSSYYVSRNFPCYDCLKSGYLIALRLLTYQTATSHQKFASGVHDNLRKQGEK